MDFDFTSEQDMLRDSVRKWVAKDYTFEKRRAIVKAGGFSQESWGALAGLGLMGLAIPEAHDGLGFGPGEAMVVMEELGRGLVLEPYAHVALVAAGLLRDAAGPEAQEAAWLPKIAAGEATVVLAHVEHGARHDLAKVHTQATQAGGQWQITGSKMVVPIADVADAYIVPAQTAEGVALFLVERKAAGVEVRAYSTQDGSRAGDVKFRHAPATLIVEAVKGMGGKGAALATLGRAADIGIAAVCAEAIGAMDALFAMTIDYMNTRKQFGVPIGTFQALRHRVADMKLQLELARSMSYYATLKLGEDDETRRRALAAAKVQIGNSARFVGQQAVQLHGGIGVTDEYAAGHYFKRLTAIELTFGDTLHHLGRYSSMLRDTAGVA
ncbi:MAG: acyl-CoA dehydrogenase family protein [Burkholderiaceae bacterium]